MYGIYLHIDMYLKTIMFMHSFCFCYINFKVTNLTLYMYLFIMYGIYLHISMYLKTILAVNF